MKLKKNNSCKIEEKIRLPKEALSKKKYKS
jgi:hypothetical protein